MDRATLDKYFQKRVRPSEDGPSGSNPCVPSESTSGRCDSAMADREPAAKEAGSDAREPPGESAAEAVAKQGQGKGNLEAYFDKRAKTTARSLRRKKGCSVSLGLADYETRGRLAANLTHRYLKNSLDSMHASWTTLQLPNSNERRVPSPWDSHQPAPSMNSRHNYISSVDFSQDGSRLLCAHASGTLAVFPGSHLPRVDVPSYDINGKENTSYFHAAAGWQVDINRLNERAAFSPRDNNKIVCVGSESDCVRIFDLNLPANAQLRGQQVLRGGPKQGLTVGRKRMGYSDCVAMPCNSPIGVAAVSSAAVHAWDERASSSRPTMQFHGPRLNAGSSSGFKCIEQSYGGQALHVGTEGGMVHTWDVRGGRTPHKSSHAPATPLTSPKSASAFTFCNQAPSSPPVSSLSIPYELQQVQPTKAPVREVQSLCANPSNGQQMAVALEGGVTGVLDLLSGQLSHAYVPDWLLLEDAVAPVDDRVMATESTLESVLLTGHFSHQTRRCSWLRSPGSEVLVAPDGTGFLHFLDMRPGSYMSAQSKGSLTPEQKRIPICRDVAIQTLLSTVHMAILNHPPICVATHPTQELIALGTEMTSWGLLRPKATKERARPWSCVDEL